MPSATPRPRRTPAPAGGAVPVSKLADALRAFRWQGRRTRTGVTEAQIDGGAAIGVQTFVNEFWTSRQRMAHSLHEISYRACFKPQLPGFFIERLTSPGGVVYDPFSGRGTTVLEAALHGRAAIGCDVNPLSAVLLEPRLSPPTLEEVAARLDEIDYRDAGPLADDLLVFFHPETLREIGALRQWFTRRARAGTLDRVDRWIRMVGVNRLTGHSPGFFSVYSLPPNQAPSVAAQRKINAARGQTPPRRDVPALILTKTRSLLADCDGPTRAALAGAARRTRLLTRPAARTPSIRSNSVDLVVTSPPFLDVVDYAADNWLRCWFCGIDPSEVRLTQLRRPEDWRASMTAVFRELARVLRPGGAVAFEVGEVRGGRLRLEELVIPAGAAAGLAPRLLLINTQQFTKTANIWGVANNRQGTNTNRIVVFEKE
ncbi:MAG: site-specific DNA-methyltransferase [Acidobacteriota bacterium]|nr:site-specific DNA-methyltransferase [Acidobacteriota bacterium]